jgi:hypothetical protein
VDIGKRLSVLKQQVASALPGSRISEQQLEHLAQLLSWHGDAAAIEEKLRLQFMPSLKQRRFVCLSSALSQPVAPDACITWHASKRNPLLQLTTLMAPLR